MEVGMRRQHWEITRGEVKQLISPNNGTSLNRQASFKIYVSHQSVQEPDLSITLCIAFRADIKFEGAHFAFEAWTLAILTWLASLILDQCIFMLSKKRTHTHEVISTFIANPDNVSTPMGAALAAWDNFQILKQNSNKFVLGTPSK